MKRTAIALVTAAITCIGHVQADETISIKAGYMMLSPSGTFAATLNNTGTQLNLDTDLRLDNSTQAMGEININLGDSAFFLGFTPMSYTGASTLARTISYNGQTFTTGTAVSSEFKADIFDIGYTYYLVNMDDLPSRIQFGIETAVKVVSARSTISGGVSSSKSITLPIPTVGVRGRVALADFIGVTARAGYLGYSGNTFTDANAQIEFSPIPTLGIFAGYRYMKLKLNNTGFVADMTLQGPFAGGFFRF